MEQVALFVTSDAFDPFAFDKVNIGFSGGTDSAACVLHCMDLGIPKDRIELCHSDLILASYIRVSKPVIFASAALAV